MAAQPIHCILRMGTKEVQVAIPDLLWNPDVATDLSVLHGLDVISEVTELLALQLVMSLLDPSKETMRIPQGNMTQLKAAMRKLVGETNDRPLTGV